MQYEIHVTDKDIARGKRQDIEACPVALVIRRTLHRPCLVSGLSVHMGRKGNGQQFKTTWWVARRIYRFDDTGVMKPFQFNLTALSEV